MFPRNEELCPMGDQTRRRPPPKARRSSPAMSPAVEHGARRLEELAALLDKVWAGESEEGLPPAVIGRVREARGDFEGLPEGQWVVVVFDRLDEQTLEGPFVTLDDAVDFAVRELSLGSLTRLVGVDTYVGREGLDEDAAPDALLEAFASGAYSSAHEPTPEWFMLHEDDRISAIRLSHRRGDGRHPPRGDTWAHAIVHLFAEASLLLGREPACREAYAAWRQAGLTRHEALHALGECIGAQLSDVGSGGTGELDEYLSAVNVGRFRGTAD